MTLRLAPGGAQERFGVTPDLSVLGKIIGGGFPVGAVAGRADVMAAIAPGSKAWHSGTFNGNPVTMAAGLVSLQELTAEKIDRMEGQAVALQTGLLRKAANTGLPLTVTRSGSLLNMFFAPEVPEAVVVRPDQEIMALFHLAAMNRGVLLAARGMMALSTVMSDTVIDEAIERFGDALHDVAAV